MIVLAGCTNWVSSASAQSADVCQSAQRICLRPVREIDLPVIWKEGDRYRVGALRLAGTGPDGLAHYTVLGTVSYPTVSQAAAAMEQLKGAMQ